MLIALNERKEPVNASRASADAIYCCPVCKEKVILKQGEFKVSHFAHWRKHACTGATEKETEEHLRGKMGLMEWAVSQGSAQLEYYIPAIRQRADLLVDQGYRWLAVEFQCSPLAVSTVCSRTEGYKQVGLPVVWISGSRLKLSRKLTALHCALMSEMADGDLCFLYFDYNSRQLAVYHHLHSLKGHFSFSIQTICFGSAGDPLSLKLEKPPAFSLLSLSCMKKRLEQLHRFRMRQDKRFRRFFEILYISNLNLEIMPKAVIQPVARDWMIRTVPEEWKLLVLTWLAGLPRNQVLTRQLIDRQRMSWMKSSEILFFAFPNVSDSAMNLPLYDFLELLTVMSVLESLGIDKWRVNWSCMDMAILSKTNECIFPDS